MKYLVSALLIVILLIGGVSVWMVIKNKKIPENLGVRSGKLAPMPSSPNAVSSQTDIEEKRVDPWPFKGGLAATRSAVLNSLKKYGNIEIVEDSGRYIHAVAVTATMKYRDDLEFYFDESENRVHFRSASRVGYSDRGLNRKRYEELAGLYADE